MTAWTAVSNVLLGSWPSQVSSWGPEGIAAYLSQLRARGLTPDMALDAIARCDERHEFPPAAPVLAALADHDPNLPTFEECYGQIYGPGGIFGFKRSDVVISPLVSAFAESYGLEKLRMLPVDGEYAGIVCRDLREAWERFVEATRRRGLAEMVAARSPAGLRHSRQVLGGLADRYRPHGSLEQDT